MAGIFFVDSIRRALGERARKKRVESATAWPQATAHINGWKVLPSKGESDSFTNTDYIEASFHFTLNGEYYGGYLNSVTMPHREAEKLATGSPDVVVRYNPTDPNQTVVLAEDNRGRLGFTVMSG